VAFKKNEWFFWLGQITLHWR